MPDTYKADNILRDPMLYTTSALVLLADRFGTEFIEWDPLTVGMEISTEFGVEPSQELLDKIQAGSSLYTSNLFFLSLETFNVVCNALNFGVTTGEMLLPADLDDILWGITESAVILGPTEFREETFSHNIARYVGAILEEAGILEPPNILKFAEYSKDPELMDEDAFEGDETLRMAFWKNQKQDRESLEFNNMARLTALMQQISRLPLVGKGSKTFRAKIQGTLQGLLPRQASSGATSP